MAKEIYIRLPEIITVAEIKDHFGSQTKPTDPTVDLPPWIWPYVRNAIKAGKLVLDRRSSKTIVPKNAEISDYSLPVIGFIQLSGIEFPGIKLAELPENFFVLVKGTMDSKKMDQYGVVDPENIHHIPRPLWPYVKFKKGFRFGEVLGKVDPEKPTDVHPGLWPYIKPATITLVRK